MLTCKRELFSIPGDVHYLNAAYMGPLSRASEAAGRRALEAKAQPYTIQAADFFRDSDEARGLFARIVNAPDPRSIAIGPSVSYGVAVAARNLEAARGQRVVVLNEEFPSNVLPWQSLAREKGLELVAVEPPAPGPGRGPAWNQRVLEAISRDTACVAVPHVHWTDGTLFDLERIGERCREVGAALVVDATQSVGALPFDVQRIRPDALVVATYKWLLGPYSLALTYFSGRFAAGRPLEEGWIARAGSEDFAGLVRYRDEYQPGALRHDMGERANLLLLPIAVAALRQTLTWGVEAIQAYCNSLTEPVAAALAPLGYSVAPAGERCGHLVGLRVPPGADASRIQQGLTERKVFVSRRGDALRLAPHVYNDSADLEALVEGLATR